MPSGHDSSAAENEALSPAKRARNEAYRGLILEAAERVFADKGYQGARIQEIAAASGLALGTIYGLYQGKAGIYQAVHERRLGELFSVLRQTLGRRERPITLLLEGNAALMRWLAEHPRYLAMHLRGGHSWGAADAYGIDVQHEEAGARWRTEDFSDGLRADRSSGESGPEARASLRSDDRGVPGGTPQGGRRRGAGGRPKADGSQCAPAFRAWAEGNQMLATFFEAGIAEGTITEGDPHAYARVLPAMIQVYISKWTEAAGELPLDAVIDELNALVARSFFVYPHDPPTPSEG